MVMHLSVHRLEGTISLHSIPHAVQLQHTTTSAHESKLGQVHTLLPPDVWEVALGAHLDRVCVAYIVQGLREGFRVGF